MSSHGIKRALPRRRRLRRANAYQTPPARSRAPTAPWRSTATALEWGVATIDVTLGFFNHLAKEMGEAIHGRVLIVEANGKVVGNAALVNGTPKLQNLSDLTLPMAAPLKALLASAGSQPVQSQYGTRKAIARCLCSRSPAARFRRAMCRPAC